MALFSVLGAVKAIELDAPMIVAVGMGVMTATFGSMIRDTLLNREPVLLGPEIYVTAALLGACCYSLLQAIAFTSSFAFPVAIGSAFLPCEPALFCSICVCPSTATEFVLDAQGRT